MSVLETYRAAIDAYGWSRTARESGYDRVTLYRHFGKKARRSPSLAELEAVGKVVGLTLRCG